MIPGQQNLTLIRRAKGGRDRMGRYFPGEETQIAFRGTVNPVPGRVLATLPEGEREGDQQRLITTFEVRATNEDTGELGDYVLYEGSRYEVRDVQVYREIIPHLEVRMRRVPGRDQSTPFTKDVPNE